MRISLRYQILAVLTVIMVGAMGAYLYLTTDLVARDKLAYAYDVISVLGNSKAEEVSSSLDTLGNRLRFLGNVVGSGDGVSEDKRAQLDSLADTLFTSDRDLIAMRVANRSAFLLRR